MSAKLGLCVGSSSQHDKRNSYNASGMLSVGGCLSKIQRERDRREIRKKEDGRKKEGAARVKVYR